jgi:hypothetical protein
MTDTERRKHRRLPLHLAVSGPNQPSASGPWVTGNVSPGGMYVRTPADQAPAVGSTLEFVLAVPAGGGHSSQDATVRGSGRVTRLEELGSGTVGLAIQFTQPLALRL